MAEVLLAFGGFLAAVLVFIFCVFVFIGIVWAFVMFIGFFMSMLMLPFTAIALLVEFILGGAHVIGHRRIGLRILLVAILSALIIGGIAFVLGASHAVVLVVAAVSAVVGAISAAS
jgi:hypothetical protein